MDSPAPETPATGGFVETVWAPIRDLLARLGPLAIPVLALVALALPREGEAKAGIGVPWFVLGFFLLAGINSTGIVPALVAGVMQTTAAWLLAAAVAATAIRSPLAATAAASNAWPPTPTYPTHCTCLAQAERAVCA